MSKSILTTSRNFDDTYSNLLDITKQYYPTIANDFNDASIGSWFLTMVSGVSDELNYHIDRVYQETNIESAQETSSIYALARSNGLKIPGPKGSMTEVEISCILPVNGLIPNSTSTLRTPNWEFAPIIKRGTKVSGAGQVFELMDDVNFSEQFDSNGISNRTIEPKRDANGNIISYTVKKLVVVVAGETQIFKKVLSSNDITPFMEVTLPSTNIMSVESVIFKQGVNYQSDPSLNDFMLPNEINLIDGKNIYRYFEVESLIDDVIWGDVVDENNDAITYTYSYYDGNKLASPTVAVTKGEWKPMKQKFITEYTDKGYLKIIFGNGIEDNVNIDLASDFSKYQISKLINNNSLGVIPPSNTTMYVLYRTGGGLASNIAKGAINTISFLNVEFGACIKDENDSKIVSNIEKSLSVTNTIPSVSGKDMPSVEEIKYMIKYNNGAQNRCVTTKDYYNRILQLPPRYGTPFRVGVSEVNNKIMINLLGINYLGHLTNELPDVMVNNIVNYLSEYRMINDFIEIKSGKIINLSFELDAYVDKNYNKSDVVVNIINTLQGYMDINNHVMGGDIFIGNLQKELSDIEGVLNIIDLRVYNEYGEGYSPTQSSQPALIPSICDVNSSLGGEVNSPLMEVDRFQIDMVASDGILYTESDTMFEIKYPEKDIKVRIKSR